MKCGISLLVYGCDGVFSAFHSVFGEKPRGRCVVLYYHAVSSEERGLFARQLDVLQRRSKCFSLGEPVQAAPGLNTAITFDDGFRNFLTEALPELQRRGIPSTMFVIAEGFGRDFGAAGKPEPMMSRDELMSLPQNLVTLGSHTMTHPMLTRVDRIAAQHEIVESKRMLEQSLDRTISLFSFPFGDFDDHVVQLAREAGYERVFTTSPALAFRNAEEFAVGRVRVDPHDWPLEFQLKLSGAYRWLPAVIAFKRRFLGATRPGGTTTSVATRPVSMIRDRVPLQQQNPSSSR